MPVSKKAFTRYRIIDECLRDKRHPYPTREYILEKFKDRLDLDDISLSTFEKDLRAMRDLPEPGYYAPIAYSSYHRGYYYEDESYTISNFAMVEEDVDAIEFAAAMLHQFKNVPMLEKFSSAIDKIMDTVNARKILTGEEFSKFVHLEKVPETKGTNYIPHILEAIKNKEVLKINHQSFYHEKPSDVILHPYLLKEFHNRWYVLGLSEEVQEIRTYGLDRIHNINTSKEVKYKKVKFDADEYFKYAIGVVSYKEKPKKLVLAFTNTQAKYLLTQPIHESQQIIKETKDRTYFSFNLHLTYEMETKILGWRDEVEVISPKAFRDKIKESLKSTLKLYK